MKEKCIRFSLLALLLAAMMLCGCSRYKQIRPLSANVENIVPNGLRSVVATIQVEIDNPASELALSDIEAVILRSGKVFGRVAVDPFVLEGRKVGTYHLRAVLTLDGGTGLMEVLGLLQQGALDECLVDFGCKVKLKGGLTKDLSFKEIPLMQLYELVRQ